jgi:hypothetical protein
MVQEEFGVEITEHFRIHYGSYPKCNLVAVPEYK